MHAILRWRRVSPQGATFHAARDIKTRRSPVSYHGHDFAEVFWIDSGTGIHQVNGSEFPLHPGSLVFIRPSDLHGIEPDAGQAIRLTNIAFPKETLEFLGARYFCSRRSTFWNRSSYPVALEIESSRLSLINRWADLLSRCPRERLYIEQFLINLLIEIESTPAQVLPSTIPQWLFHACREIEKPTHFSSGVEAFFRLSSRSREHVARSVRRHFGVSPTRYVNRVRMTHAARELEMSDREIVEIALDCGLGNLSHFYTLFREEFGTTPRAYRLSHLRSI